MAIGTPSQVATQTSQTSGQTSVAMASVVIPANSLVVLIIMASNSGTAVGDPSTVSDGTNNYTKAASSVRGTNNYHSLWYFYDTSGGTKTITATLPAASNMTFTRVWTVSGIASASPLDQIGTGQTASGTVSLNVAGPTATSQADEICFFTYSWAEAILPGTPTPTNYSDIGNQTNGTRGWGIDYAYRILSATSTEAPSVTLNSSKAWAAVFSSFKAAGGSVQGITFNVTSSGGPVFIEMDGMLDLIPLSVTSVSTVSFGVASGATPDNQDWGLMIAVMF